MYNDYPTAEYSSTVDQFTFLKIGAIVLVVAILVAFLIGCMKVFKKANRKGVSALIPFYNLITLLEICNLPKMYFAFLLIPGVNLIFFYKVEQVLAKLFKKNKLFGIGLFILPIAYYPILGYSKSEYIGINLKGMDSRNQISKIEIIDENKNKEIEIEENKEEDIATRNINISLGGGKYQKDFASNLGHVEGEQVITQRNLKEQKKQEYNQKMENLRVIELAKQEEQRKLEESKPKEEVEAKEEPIEVFDINYIQTADAKKKEEERIKQEAKEKEEEERRKELATIKCPKCGTKLPKGTEFCITCGTKL